MAGVTEKKKAGKGSYLILHRSGAVARTKNLNIPQQVDGITAIIDLETLEQYDGEKWHKIPDGCDTLILAEDQLTDEEDDYYEEEDELPPDVIQFGARRLLNPNFVWMMCKKRL